MSCRTISAPDDAPELDVFPELDGGPRLDSTGEEVSARKASKQTNFGQEVLAATKKQKEEEQERVELMGTEKIIQAKEKKKKE